MENILLVFGGDSVERDISILTALQSWGYINSDKYRIIGAYISGNEIYTASPRRMKNVKNYQSASNIGTKLRMVSGGVVKGGIFGRHIHIDCALLATHGGNGENGALQGLLEFYNIAYTSCDCGAAALTMNKVKCIEKAINIGISAPKTDCYCYGQEINYADTLKKMGGKTVVKPNALGSSIGVTAVSTVDQVSDAVAAAFCYDNEVLIQEAVANLAEYNCAAMTKGGHVIVSEVEEPISASEILDFDSKYRDNGKMSGAKRNFPAEITAELKATIQSNTLKIYREMALFGVVRVDYLYNKVEKKLYFNEVNAIPGSLAYYLFSGNGFNRIDMMTYLIESGIARHQAAQRITKSFDSSLLGKRKGSGMKV